MSIILRIGAVTSSEITLPKDMAAGIESDIMDAPGPPDDYHPPPQTYPGCYGLPYQDHNYGALPPPTPPQSPPPLPVSPVKVNGHVDVVEVTTSTCDINVELPIDDSITRCICNFQHDDGYMICCDTCGVWQHIDCMGIDRANIPENYFCDGCQPRELDRERARQIQMKKREDMTDSSATDTDPEEAKNRLQALAAVVSGKKEKKTRKKKTKDKIEPKQKPKKQKKEKVKKDRIPKETREIKIQTDKEIIPITKPVVPKLKPKKDTKKTPKLKVKLQLNRKPNTPVIENEDARDIWNTSLSPWVETFEEINENRYSTAMKEILTSKRINGQHGSEGGPSIGELLVQLCYVAEVKKSRKGLEALQSISEGQPIIEYVGKVMLKEQFEKDNQFFKHMNPFVMFYSKFDGLDLCVDATTVGNAGRFIRRSCKPNAEVRHVVEPGQIHFFIFSTEEITKDTEVTIPYDYNYKDCCYCVDCACLRNNCPVSRYWNRIQVVKKPPFKKQRVTRAPVKSPVRSPVKSPVRSPVKSPVRPVVKSPLKVSPKSPVRSPPIQTPPQRSPVKTPEKTMRDSSIQVSSPKESPIPVLIEPLSDTLKSLDQDSQSGLSLQGDNEIDAADRKSMTREDRKMEAILKAFEKMEKREERRKEALARIETTKKGSDTKSRKEVEVQAAPEPPVQEVIPIKKEPKPSRSKKKKVSSAAKRKTRIQSALVTEPIVSSAEENSNTAQPASCPTTPVPKLEDTTSPPSFKVLKTKRHLMKEWLHDKSNETKPGPIKTEPLELNVNVDDSMFVTCMPSPRNTLDRLRRNSQSSGCSGSGKSASESIGSAKKRWLRQAMGESPVPPSVMMQSPGHDSGRSSPIHSSGAMSPNHCVMSPCSSPPHDFVTPLKKRKLARESMSSEQSPSLTPSTLSPTAQSSTGQELSLAGTEDSFPEDPENLENKNEFCSELSALIPSESLPSDKFELPKKVEMEESAKVAKESPCDDKNPSTCENIFDQTEESNLNVDTDIKVENENESPLKVSKEEELECSSGDLQTVTNSSGSVRVSAEADSSERDVVCKAEEEDTVSDSAVVKNECPQSSSKTVDSAIKSVEVDSTQSDEPESSVVVKEHDPATSLQACHSESDVCSDTDIASKSPLGSHLEKSRSKSESLDPDSTKTENTEGSPVKQQAVKLDEQADSSSNELTSSIKCTSSTDRRDSLANKEINSSIHQTPVLNTNSVDNCATKQSVFRDENISDSSDTMENKNTSQDIVSASTSVEKESTSEIAQSSDQKLSESLVDSTTLTVPSCDAIDVSSSGLDTEQNSNSNVSEQSISQNCESFQNSCVTSHAMGSIDLMVNTSSSSEAMSPPVKDLTLVDDCVNSVLNGCSVNSTSTDSQPTVSSAPAKKKVSLLEYRKRQKEKIRHNSSSSGKASSNSVSSTSASLSLDNLPSLNPLPLFEPLIPPKDRHQFKSSSDLVRRERKSSGDLFPEKQMSLSERLRQEFGLEDSEEEEIAKSEQAPVPEVMQFNQPALLPPQPVPLPTGHQFQHGGIQTHMTSGSQMPSLMSIQPFSKQTIQGKQMPPPLTGLSGTSTQHQFPFQGRAAQPVMNSQTTHSAGLHPAVPTLAPYTQNSVPNQAFNQTPATQGQNPKPQPSSTHLVGGHTDFNQYHSSSGHQSQKTSHAPIVHDYQHGYNQPPSAPLNSYHHPPPMSFSRPRAPAPPLRLSNKYRKKRPNGGSQHMYPDSSGRY